MLKSSEDIRLETLKMRISDRAFKVVRFDGPVAQSVYVDLCGRGELNGESGENLKTFYPLGELVIAPTNIGLFCWPTESKAIEDAQTDYRTGGRAVLEVIPLGPSQTAGFKGIRYPAVIPIRKVWRENKPEEEAWEDITMECKLHVSPATGSGGAYILVMYRAWEVCAFDGLKPVRFHIKPRAGRPEFKMECIEHPNKTPLVSSVISERIGSFRIFARLPKEAKDAGVEHENCEGYRKEGRVP